jgi:hypothetical protein
VLRKVVIVIVVAALGVGSALGVAACGEDREGEVQFEDGTGTAGTGTARTGTVGTETAGTGTVETEPPETETEAETGEAETAP